MTITTAAARDRAEMHSAAMFTVPLLELDGITLDDVPALPDTALERLTRTVEKHSMCVEEIIDLLDKDAGHTGDWAYNCDGVTLRRSVLVRVFADDLTHLEAVRVAVRSREAVAR